MRLLRLAACAAVLVGAPGVGVASTDVATASVSDLSMTALADPSAYWLIDAGDWSKSLAFLSGVGMPVTYDDVLDDIGSTTDDVGEPVENFDPTEAGQTWHGEEASATLTPTNRWDPQGIAMGRGSVAHDLIVSWYDGYHARHPNGRDEGSSVTFVDSANGGYRRVLLIRPHGPGNFLPVDTHAGGIARVGPLLYVADKAVGLRVYNLDQMRKVWTGTEGACDSRVGRQQIDGHTRYCAYGLKYILPQVDTYKLPQDGPMCGPQQDEKCYPDGQTPLLRFSALTLDTTSSPARITVAEFCNGYVGGAVDWRCPYDEGSHTAGRVVAWPVAPGGALANDNGIAVADQAYVSNVQGIQGLTSSPDGPGTYLLSAAGGRLVRIGTTSDYPSRVWSYAEDRSFVHANEGIVVDHSDPSNPWLWVATENTNEYADGDGIYVGRGVFADALSRYSATGGS